MNGTKRSVVAIAVAVFVVASLLVPADPALAKTKFHFDFLLGGPLTPYPAYVYPYYPAPVYYPPVRYRAYPPCAQVFVPGYYDPYGNWIFGYFRYECGGYYGY